MGRCGCEMVIECEVKISQTVESIENTIRKEGEFVVVQKYKILNGEVYVRKDC